MDMDEKASGGPVIAVVDDDTDFIEWNRCVLEQAGYRTVCSTDPQRAFDTMRDAPPDLVISDLMMQSLDSGFSLARKIKSEPSLKHVPVIIVTAADSSRGFNFRPQSADDLAAMNADAFFSKPVAPAKLLAKVAELLASRAKGE